MATMVRSGYVVYADSCLCKCPAPRRKLAESRKLDAAIKQAKAHWSIYVTFWGHTTHWIDFIVVNASDGVIEWRNGQPTREVNDGNTEDETRPANGGWLAGRSTGEFL